MKEHTYRKWSIGIQVATLVIVGVIGIFVQRAITREGVAAAYVDIAASILAEPATKETVETGMRCWALALLIEHSPDAAPIPEKLRQAMLEGRVIGWQPAGYQPEGHQPDGYQPQLIVDPECKL